MKQDENKEIGISKEGFLLKKWLERLKTTTSGAGGRRWIVIAGLLGMGLILLSSLWPSSTDKTAAEADLSWDAAAYAATLEQQLTAILEQMEGVGECRVMITLDKATEYVYSDRNEVVTQVQPTVKGVVVVCAGASDLSVAERVETTVQTVLHITARRVCVMPLI